MTRGVDAAARLAVFLGAFLLFGAQPLVSRMLLPVLGGSAQVWNTCTVFFQVALLAGYLLAHEVGRRPAGRGIALGVLAAYAAAATALPPAFPADLAPPAGPLPVGWVLGLLVVHVGPWFVLVAATAPLVQRWLAGRRDASEVYGLYAASNAGSLLALAAQPFLLEPALGLAGQARLVAGGVAALALLLAGLAATLGGGAGGTPAVVPAAPPVPRGLRLRWLALAAVPSSLLLGVTAHLAQEVPATPLAWVVPLALYLGSFVLVFRPGAGDRAVPRALFPLLVAVLAIVLFVPLRLAGFTLHLAALLVVSWVLHGELADARPEPAGLTGYYLTLAAGGALGGAANALLAPALLPAHLEYPLALVAACFLYPRDEPGLLPGWTARLDVAIPATLAVVGAGVQHVLPSSGDAREVAARVGVLLVLAAAALACRRRARRFGLAVGAVLLAGFVGFRLPGTLRFARSYYGSYRVVRVPGTARLELHHGSTIHGAQDRGRADGSPTSYFHPASPIAGVLRRAGEARARVAVVGLGVGALAWYTRPGQRLRFLEIDPVVVELAEDPELFTFLRDASGEVRVDVGDGRRLLAMAPAASAELVVLDAFASDAIPVHLVTREALATYRRVLAPGGALVFNVSNRHVRLVDLVARLAADAGLAAREVRAPELGPADQAAGRVRARWLAVGPPGVLARWAPETEGWRDRLAPRDAPVWRDDHAALLPYLRW